MRGLRGALAAAVSLAAAVPTALALPGPAAAAESGAQPGASVAPAAANECITSYSVQGAKVVARITKPGSCDWTVPNGVTSIEYLLVGGGGGSAGTVGQMSGDLVGVALACGFSGGADKQPDGRPGHT